LSVRAIGRWAFGCGGEVVSIVASALFLLPSLAFKRCAASTLARALDPEHAKRIWRTTLELQASLAKERPLHSLGTDLVLRLMEWDYAIYRAARQGGVNELEAKRLVEEINWHALGPVIAMSFPATRLRSPRLVTRVSWLLDLMFRIIFTAPFRRTTYPRADEVAFDVDVCPLAQYFKARGVPELTSAAACSLDHRMATVWGMTLHRTQTIADGYPRCDFRFRAKQADTAAPPN
jgi:hypothetical protein